jgi:uncharacterized membrane protein YphA (DoxX/SURF4 family)
MGVQPGGEMMRNPFSDAYEFLFSNTVLGRAPIYFFIFLLLASFVIAAYNLLRDSSQRTATNIYIWLARCAIGGLWFEQTLWKLPPTFTDNPDGVTGGLRYWMTQMGQYAALGVQSAFVNNIVLPHFKVFAYQVWAIETLIAVSLLLGLFTRLGGLLGALMALNLWLGLYNAPNEWPWTYFFLLLLMGFFIVTRAGRALGLDALISSRRNSVNRPAGGRVARAAALMS